MARPIEEGLQRLGSGDVFEFSEPLFQRVLPEQQSAADANRGRRWNTSDFAADKVAEVGFGAPQQYGGFLRSEDRGRYCGLISGLNSKHTLPPFSVVCKRVLVEKAL